MPQHQLLKNCFRDPPAGLSMLHLLDERLLWHVLIRGWRRRARQGHLGTIWIRVTPFQTAPWSPASVWWKHQARLTSLTCVKHLCLDDHIWLPLMGTNKYRHIIRDEIILNSETGRGYLFSLKEGVETIVHIQQLLPCNRGHILRLWRRLQTPT